MSLRYTGAWMQDGAFNPLAAPAPIYSPGTLWGWGYNANGQLGLNNATNFSSPNQVGSSTTWSQVSIEYSHGAAIKTDGTLWTWGYNSSGQLGIGNTTQYSSPKQVGSLTTWLYVSCGGYNTLAIKTDGTLWAWGNNGTGALGLGDTTNRSSPTQVGSLTTWSKISASLGTFSMAIKTDGTLWAWGGNGFGQLGLGNTTYSSSPNQVGSLTNWSYVAAGQNGVTYAIKTDGTLWTWGRNNYGQLGLGTSGTNYSSPKQVGALTTWSSAAGAYESSIAIKTDGTLWSWGGNTYGQLGLGNTSIYSSPKQIGSLTTWSKISTGTYSVIATKTDYTLWSWGFNQYGLLGLGNTTAYSSPKQVGLLTKWLQVSCSGYSTMALQY